MFLSALRAIDRPERIESSSWPLCATSLVTGQQGGASELPLGDASLCAKSSDASQQLVRYCLAMAFYRLADNVVYRREGFGGTTLVGDAPGARFFNKAASRVIEACLIQRLPSEVSFEAGIPLGKTKRFLERLHRAGILEESKYQRGSLSHARHYFTDRARAAHEGFSGPLGVEIELTLHCHRRCSYCAYDAGPSVSQKDELQLDGWLQALNHLSSQGVLFLRLTGGDPLTHPSFVNVFKAVDDLGFHSTVGTDLTSLSNCHIDALASAKRLHAVQTSLDGGDSRTADRFRGAGNFAEVTTGISRIVSSGVRVVVGTVITQHNCDQVREIAVLLASLGVSGFWISPLIGAGRGSALDDHRPSVAQMDAAMRTYSDCVASGIIESADPAWGAIAPRLSEDALGEIWKDHEIQARTPDRVLRVDPVGRCYPSIQSLQGVGSQTGYLGNLMNESLTDIWPRFLSAASSPERVDYFGTAVTISHRDRPRSRET